MDSNHISSLTPGLTTLTQLTVLSVNDNHLTSLNGVEPLTQLKKLSAARNFITDVVSWSDLHPHSSASAPSSSSSSSNTSSTAAKSSPSAASGGGALCLDPLKQLEELNLSDNRLTHFNTLRSWFNRARLPRLRVLALSDPHYGDNPMCALSHYHTVALVALPHLVVFDGIKLSDATGASAQATFMKKQVCCLGCWVITVHQEKGEEKRRRRRDAAEG